MSSHLPLLGGILTSYIQNREACHRPNAGGEGELLYKTGVPDQSCSFLYSIIQEPEAGSLQNDIQG